MEDWGWNMLHDFTGQPANRERRACLRRLTGIGAGILIATSAWPALATLPRRTLKFHHTHTNERLSIDYHADGQYIPGALAHIDRYLGDFRTGDVHPIDPQLLDLMFTLTTMAGGTAGTFEVISGYRSPQTNMMLRSRGAGGVATRSLHMDGKAVDVRLTGTDISDLRRHALELKAGGVGYYPHEGFVHLDTGRVRNW